MKARIVLLPAFLLALFSAGARSDPPAPPQLSDIGFDQHIGAILPLDARFTDERGASGPLSRFLSVPTILVLGYRECPNLCSVVRQSLARSLGAVGLQPGSQYAVIAVSIDPAENAIGVDREHAADAEASAPAASGAPSGWHFLSGDDGAVTALTRSVGFRYVYDAGERQFVHPAGIVVVTPQGRIARYFFGVAYPPVELRQSLLDAATERLASPAQALLMLCMHYDPATGRYSATIGSIARVLGFGSAAALAGLIVALRRRERRA